MSAVEASQVEKSNYKPLRWSQNFLGVREAKKQKMSILQFVHLKKLKYLIQPTKGA